MAKSFTEMPYIFDKADPLGAEEEEDTLDELPNFPARHPSPQFIHAHVSEYGEEEFLKEEGAPVDAPSTSVGSNPCLKSMPNVSTVDNLAILKAPKWLQVGAEHCSSGV
ncbi:hypothetical protein NDU88_003560 [Pleurodeles waltl]|uniref:Uncharacterized protein n=1 Tax=Pleurodeles waltl TaxID=8319 RepID=A0AAV7SFE5_PLEWA|nr:hypothetical protein NDU88_003560 [Pleurodeles waltl]